MAEDPGKHFGARLYLFTIAAEVCVVTSLAVCFKLAGSWWSAEEFGLYALFRRVLSFVLPAVTLGLDVGLPRSIALADASAPDKRAALVLAAGALCLTMLLVVAIASVVAPGAVAAILFGSATRAAWLVTLVLLLLAYSTYVIAFGYWRGRLRILRSSSLYVFVFSIAPVAALFAFPHDPMSGLNALGVGVLGMSLLFVPWSEPLGLPWARVRAAIVELWSYGFSRFGTAVGIMLLFALPALMAARSGDLGLGGVLAFSVTAVGAAGSAAGPIATVLLPLAARAVSGGSMARVTADFRFWTRLFMGGAVAGTVLVVYFGDAVMRFFVPAELAAYSNVFRVSLCALVPYAYYCMARPVVDGVSHKPYNAISTVCALLTFAFVWVLGSRLTDWPPGIAECVSLCAAMLVLAVRSWFFIRRALDVERP